MANEQTSEQTNGNGNQEQKAREEQAFHLAQEFAPVADFVTSVLDAGETTKRGPLDLMQRMTEAGIDLDKLPVPGEKTGNNPDIYDGTRLNDKGEWKAYKGSHIKDAVLKTKEGSALVEAITAVNSKAGKWADCGDIRRDSEKKVLEARRNAMVSLYSRAIKLNHWFNKIGDLPGVDWEPVTDTVMVDGKPTEQPARTTSPIVVYNPAKRSEFETMSVGQFLQLDPDEAKEQGGTYTALIRTLGREGGSGQGDTGTKTPRIKNIEGLLSALNDISSYLDPETDEGQKNQAKLAVFMANKKLGDDVIETVGDAAMALDHLSTVIMTRYADMKAREAGNNGDKRAKLAEAFAKGVTGTAS
jgi:hypothetical protein